MEKESIIQRLKQNGLRITRQRLAIIDVLIAERHLHPGVSMIYREARKRNKSLSLSTTYATIHEFVRCGIIRALEFDGKESRCEGNFDEHINLICNRCETIIDYRASVYAHRMDVVQTAGFVITGGRWEYYGYCRDCSIDQEIASPAKESPEERS